MLCPRYPDREWTFVTPLKNIDAEDFPGGPVVKNPPANAGDMVPSLVWEDSTGMGASKPMLKFTTTETTCRSY